MSLTWERGDGDKVDFVEFDCCLTCSCSDLFYLRNSSMAFT